MNGRKNQSKKEKKNLKKQIKNNKRRSKLIRKNERLFSARKYMGKGKKIVYTEKGNSVLAISALHSVNYFEQGEKKADRYSGGLARLLIHELGCNGISLRKHYDANQTQPLEDEISKFIVDNKIQLLLDIQVSDFQDDSVLEVYMKQQNTKFDFVKDAIRYSFEYFYRDSGLDTVVKCSETSQSDMAEKISSQINVANVRIIINKKYCNPFRKNDFSFFYNAMLDTLAMFTHMDWSSETIKVFRLWQSSSQKPQDKIELYEMDSIDGLDENDLLNICTYGTELEQVRLHKASDKTKDELKAALDGDNDNLGKEYIFLTNRLIEILFGREWIEGEEEKAGLRGAPVIVYENAKEVYPIGLPKANQIDGVFFSTELYNEKKLEAKNFDYIIFNRYTDSRLFIEFEKTDYGDSGRVKDDNGQPTKKVMIPRYYKRLLGYLDSPLRMIRSEEYSGIISKLSHQITECENDESRLDELDKLREKKNAFEACYEKIDGEIFYRLKNQFVSDYDSEEEPEEDIKKLKDLVIDVQNHMGLFNNVEIQRIPKEVKSKEKIYKRLLRTLDRFKISILKKSIGKAEYLLKTEWTSETDDKNNIARLSSNMMNLLGVSENDKILVRFGKKQEILRVLVDDKLTDYQIGVPAPARKKLGMNSVNDIVIVHRDMVHIFWRHSEEQTIAILGTVLAVFQVVSEIWVGVLLCAIVTPLIMYFVLNEERVKVK